jgi:glycyl-tRNA synthetase
LVQTLGGREMDFDLRQGLALAAEGLPIAASPETLAACLDFIVARMRSYLIEQQGFRYDVVDAVLAEQQVNPAGVFRAVSALAQWVTRSDWSTILPAFSRCVRITRDQKQRYAIDPTAFVDPAERDLFAALETAPAWRSGSVEDFLNGFVPLVPVINRFFEAVLVMAEEPAVRANRLGLLQRVAALSAGVADFSKLEGF